MHEAMGIWSGQNIEATLFCFKDREILSRMDFDTVGYISMPTGRLLMLRGYFDNPI